MPRLEIAVELAGLRMPFKKALHTAARLLADLPEGTMGVDFNPGNLVLAGFSPQEALDALGPSVLHVHATDAAPDLAANRGSEVLLGEGTVDFPSLLGLLDQHGYRGYFTPAPRTSADRAQEVAEAIEFLRRL